jgi:hypothetical protein
MSKGKYETSKLEFGNPEEATREQLVEILRLANDNRVISKTDLILAMVAKYGEEVWDVVRAREYETGLRRSEIYYGRLKASGDDRFLPDPRVIRREVRFVTGTIGRVHHGNEVVEGNPAAGRFKLTFEIDRCAWDYNWRRMGLTSDIRQKLCRSLGNSSDTAIMDFFGIWLFEGMGLTKSAPTCFFELHGPKAKEEHEAWGNSLQPHLKKYYHPWPWCT